MGNLLPKHRYRDILAVETGPLENGNRGVAGWVSATVSYPDGEAISPCFPAINIHFYQSLGMIVCNWSMFEVIMDQMTQILLDHLGKKEPNWRKRLNYNQRRALHRSSFEEAFAGESHLQRYHKEILSMVTEPKKVRDGIAHAMTTQGLAKGEQSIIFIETNMRLPTEKRYDGDALDRIRIELSHASGFLEGLAIAEPPLEPLSSREISALQQVFGRDRWKEATLRALKIQPRS
jgi:hypothetical protein